MGNVAWKVLSLVAGLAATKAATAAVNGTWKAAAGQPAPKNQHDRQASSVEAALFAIVSAAAVAGAKVYAERKAADYYVKSTGHQPKAVQKKQEKAAEKRQEELAKS